jgi:sporulation protein YtfJ
MVSENKLEDIIRASIENMRSMVNANTVIGDPYTTPGGITIIPVSKISVGFASGGLDYFGKQSQKQGSDKPSHPKFGGGGGSGLTVSPVGFLVIGSDGRVEMVNIGVSTPSETIDQITDFIERSPEILASIKEVFTKKSDARRAMEDK